MKKIFIPVALIIFVFSSSWSSDSELKEVEDLLGVFGGPFELEEESDKDELSDDSLESQGHNKELGYMSSAPILIKTDDQEKRTRSGSLPTNSEPTFNVGSFEPSSYMPGSYSSYLEEETRKKIRKEMETNLSPRGDDAKDKTMKYSQKKDGNDSD